MHRHLILLCFLFAACKTSGSRPGTAYLGVMYAHTRQGVEIVQVLPNSPALQVGLSIGDTIVAVNGERVNRARTLSSAIQAQRPGERVRLTVLRASGIQEDLEAEVDSVPVTQ